MLVQAAAVAVKPPTVNLAVPNKPSPAPVTKLQVLLEVFRASTLTLTVTSYDSTVGLAELPPAIDSLLIIL